MCSLQPWWATRLDFATRFRADDGVYMISKTFNRIGQMARDPRGLASLTKALVRSDEHRKGPLEDEAAPFESLWGSLSIGVLDSGWENGSASKWKWGSTQVVSLSRWRCFCLEHELIYRPLPRETSTFRLCVAWRLNLV